MYMSVTLSVDLLSLALPLSTCGLLLPLFIYFVLPYQEGGTAQVSAHGAILFGVALLALECLTCAYTHFAHKMVMARVGVVGGYKGCLLYTSPSPRD